MGFLWRSENSPPIVLISDVRCHPVQYRPFIRARASMRYPILVPMVSILLSFNNLPYFLALGLICRLGDYLRLSDFYLSLKSREGLKSLWCRMFASVCFLKAFDGFNSRGRMPDITVSDTLKMAKTCQVENSLEAILGSTNLFYLHFNRIRGRSL